MGGYYGARLHHAGLDVHFLLHSDFDHVQAHGFKVISKHGDFSIPRPKIYRSVRDMPRCDVALIGLKTTANHLLPDLVPHAIQDDGVALVMQNGLGAEEKVAPLLKPSQAVLGGLAFLCSHKVGPGEIHHMDYDPVRLGEFRGDGQPAGVTPRLSAVAEDFRRAGIHVDIEEDLLLARWKKLVWNIPYNGLCVVMNCTTDRLMQHPRTRELCGALMCEVAAGAAACGRTVGEDFIQTMLSYTDKMVAYKPSMLLDHEQKRPMELEAIYANPLAAARARGVHLPRVQMLYQQLCAIDDLSTQAQ